MSTDVTALRNIVKLDFVTTSAKWEVFGTPEYDGGIPGPTDFMTLIAELTPDNQKAFAIRRSTGAVWIAPESARPWLDSHFRNLLGEHRNAQFDLSKASNCGELTATFTQSGRPAKGFTCSDKEKLLVYITVKTEKS